MYKVRGEHRTVIVHSCNEESLIHYPTLFARNKHEKSENKKEYCLMNNHDL